MPSKFKYLVVDTSAFIKNVQLQDIADEIITIPDVMKEVKHNRQIKRLAVLPYDLKVMKPTAENIQFVAEFAKKTGDFAVLSLTDMTVIALTYQLELKHVGSSHLRAAPITTKTIYSDRRPKELANQKSLVGFYKPTLNKSEGLKDNELINDERENQDNVNNSESESEEFIEDLVNQLKNQHLSDKFAPVTDENVIAEVEDILKPVDGKEVDVQNSDDEDNYEDATDHIKDDENENADEVDEEEHNSDDSEADDNDDDDEEGWITPANIKSVKRDYGTNLMEATPSDVACITTDYAMQNVLKQIGLSVAALDGRVIKQTRTFILRCYACFKTTTDPSKIFCGTCGNKTLKRVAVSLDENGQQVIHINTKRAITAKYKNKSLPAPKGGKHALNPILREDQPIPQQRISAKARAKTDALSDDYIAGFSPFVMRDTDSRSAMMRNSNDIKQWMTNYEYDNHRRGYKKFTK